MSQYEILTIMVILVGYSKIISSSPNRVNWVHQRPYNVVLVSAGNGFYFKYKKKLLFFFCLFEVFPFLWKKRKLHDSWSFRQSSKWLLWNQDTVWCPNTRCKRYEGQVQYWLFDHTFYLNGLCGFFRNLR